MAASTQVWRARASRFALTFLALLPGLSGAACVGPHAIARQNIDGLAPAIAWFSPSLPSDSSTLERWRASVGPPVVLARPLDDGRQRTNSLLVVSWNTALGAGDIVGLVNDLRRKAAGVPIVLLLQEVYRGGPEVPSRLSGSALFASRLTGLRVDGGRDEIESIASRLELNTYYVPSMRNGSPMFSDEDRGNAILSSLPLSDLAAFELPFERQRRVAVGASIRGISAGGEPWQLRVVSVHLDNMAGPKRLWLAAEFGRVRQTRGLLSQFRNAKSIVLGGDFNTWFGFSDQAFREAAKAFPQTRVNDRRATFHGLLRLDHLFFRLPDGWHADFRRADDNYGSDHYPLIATITLS
jgi:endonuclease/exonuclease/phosphatase family metal-dependent hydrolase